MTSISTPDENTSIPSASTLQTSWMATNTSFEASAPPTHDGTKSNHPKRSLEKRWMETLTDLVKESSDGNHCANSASVRDFLERWFAKISDLHTNMSTECDFDLGGGGSTRTMEKRHYHTLVHLDEMFGYIDVLVPHELLMLHHFNTTSPHETATATVEEETTISAQKMYDAVITLAVFFHDAIYNPKSSTNEEDSVTLYKTFEAELLKCIHSSTDRGTSSSTSLQVPLSARPNSLELYSRHIQDFILATKSHTPTTTVLTEDETFTPSQLLHTVYQNIFLDADMAVLGKQPNAYKQYAALIRMEYNHVPHDVYCSKRADVLESFASSLSTSYGGINSGSEGLANVEKTVFLTRTMKEAFEEYAIQNLREEIASLKRGEIPNNNGIK